MTRFYHHNSVFNNRILPIQKLRKIGLLLILPAAAILYSCEQSPTIIGDELLPVSDFVNIFATDTITVKSFTGYVDSVRSNNRTYSYLGGLYDPYFGNTSADFVSQLRITRKYSGGEPLVDSVKLFMSIVSAKGDLNISQKLELYEISEQLYQDSSYYSNRDPRADAWFIGSFPLPAITKDSIKTFIIPLPDTLGKHLMRDTLSLNQEGGVSDFRSFFKGIYIRTVEETKSPGKGSFSQLPLLMVLPFNTGDFTIKVYYHTAKLSNLTYDFIINLNSVRYNRYYHDFSTAEPGKMIQNINNNVMDTLCYIQSFNGVFTGLRFPALNQLKSLMPVSVNKAKLTFSVYFDEDIYKSTTVPSRIYLSYVTPDGFKAIVPDYYVNANFFDGTFNSTTKKYSFNLTAFVQLFLEGKIQSPEVEMYFPDGEFRNVILKSDISFEPVKFDFIYTRY
jgi:hypothetical protein